MPEPGETIQITCEQMKTAAGAMEWARLIEAGYAPEDLAWLPDGWCVPRDEIVDCAIERAEASRTLATEGADDE